MSKVENSLSIDGVKKIIEDCGIVGAGGAGFPTHLKIDARASTLILNCAECEPVLTLHRQLLTNNADIIISTLRKLSDILGAKTVVAVKKTANDTIDAVQKVLTGCSSATLTLLEDAYPAGDEIILIYEATGVLIPPGTLPIESGFVVLNVETIYNIYYALERGKTVTHKWVTIAGEVSGPTTVHIPIGTTISDAVKLAGEITTDDPAFLRGGPMMGSIVSGDDEVNKTTNAIIVLPKGHHLTKRSRPSEIDINRAASACCQCRTCTEMCPRYLLGYPIEPNKIMRALASRDYTSEAFKGVIYCSLCGLCEMVACPQSLAPRGLISVFKSALANEGTKPERLDASPLPEREYRRISKKRLAARLGLAKYSEGGHI